MTPLEIKIALHYYVCADDYPNLSPPAQQQTIEYFLTSGYLVRNESGESPQYVGTDKLDAYCKKLCAVSEPRRVWV